MWWDERCSLCTSQSSMNTHTNHNSCWNLRNTTFVLLFPRSLTLKPIAFIVVVEAKSVESKLSKRNDISAFLCCFGACERQWENEDNFADQITLWRVFNKKDQGAVKVRFSLENSRELLGEAYNQNCCQPHRQRVWFLWDKANKNPSRCCWNLGRLWHVDSRSHPGDEVNRAESGTVAALTYRSIVFHSNTKLVLNKKQSPWHATQMRDLISAVSRTEAAVRSISLFNP